MTFLRRWWPLLLLAVAVVVGVFYVNHLRNRATEAEQDRDRAALRAAGANAVAEAGRAGAQRGPGPAQPRSPGCGGG